MPILGLKIIEIYVKLLGKPILKLEFEKNVEFLFY